MTKSTILSRLNNEYSYVRVRLTLTSRVVAGWAITLVGLIKLWQTNDPAAWWPILMGGTGLMIVSRGVDHYLNNKEKEQEQKIVASNNNSTITNPYQHAQMDEMESIENQNSALQKHKEYRGNLPV